MFMSRAGRLTTPVHASVHQNAVLSSVIHCRRLPGAQEDLVYDGFTYEGIEQVQLPDDGAAVVSVMVQGGSSALLFSDKQPIRGWSGVGRGSDDGGEVVGVQGEHRQSGVVGIDGIKGDTVRGGESHGLRNHGLGRPPADSVTKCSALLFTRGKGAPFIEKVRAITPTLSADKR